MTFHVVCQVGSDDQYLPTHGRSDEVFRVGLDRPGDRQAVRNNIEAEFSRHSLSVPSQARDLLRFAISAYCADVGVRRSEGHDAWTRDFHLHVPVAEPRVWCASEGTLSELLGFLTGDRWEVTVRRLGRTRSTRRPSGGDGGHTSFDAVALFSGGLDSFVGVTDLLNGGLTAALVGHHGAGTTNKTQKAVYERLAAKYDGRSRLVSFYLQPPPPLKGGDPEKSTRSRSMLFLALGAAVAAGSHGGAPLVVPENGFISLNPALTEARTGSLSTRTTHPYTMRLYSDLLRRVGVDVKIRLPYQFLTKGEMVQQSRDIGGFRSGVQGTVSCAHPEVVRWARRSPGEHCGYCLPCIVRRAALSRTGLDRASDYYVDVLRSPPSAKSRAGSDLRAVRMALEQFGSKPLSRSLFDVLDTGPIPPEDVGEYVGVYRRGMEEVHAFLTER